jgi:hypothetical protein
VRLSLRPRTESSLFPMWRGDAANLAPGDTVRVPASDGHALSRERVPATYVSQRERRVRDPSDGSTSTVVYVRVRYSDGREKEWVPEAVDRDSD